MSYCVNCGVELERGLAACPLCRCPVVNPMDGAPSDSPLPQRVDKLDNLVERRFFSVVITVILLFAGLICLLIDLVYNGAVTWSAISLAGLGLAWVTAPLPLWPRRMGLRRALGLDAAVLLLFLWLLDARLDGSTWFATLALPIVVSVTLLFIGVATLAKNGRVRGWRLAAVIVVACGLAVMAVDCSVNWHAQGHIFVQWSWLAMAPCAAVAAILLVIDRKTAVQESLGRWFHI